ncbi:MAG TPA: DUF2865 domain-containing protein [Bradyrhizobium sp.]|nr:DUF2865 domain-containing protein [Bradyrhizobium sp.]
MPETLITSLSRWILACAALFGVVALSVDASAQMNPGPPPPQGTAVNPMCPRLEAQLATIDRGGGGDPAKDEQIRRYQDAAAKQQSELDRVTSQAKRMGCDSSGFFSLFSGQSAQCGPVNNQIQQMRANLEQITTSLERLRGGFGGSERDSQRRSVLAALAQNNCGPQYANAARGPGSFLESLFGNNNNNNSNPMTPGVDLGPQSGTYRTVCVRTCDGFYFPISFATVPARFPDDERTCKNLCPAAEASLFSYRNPGEDMNQAVSINGQPYSSSPNAFRYRQEFNPSCACKAAGQTWSDALKTIDDKASAEQQGDIIVTEESAKKMSRVPTKGAAAAAKKGAAPAGTTATAPATPEASPPAAGSTAAAPDNKPIRSVGPTFIPAR